MAGSRITPPPPDPNLLIQYDIHIPGEAGEFYVDDPAFDGEEDDSCWWEPSLAKKLGSLAEMGHEGARLVYQWGMGVAVVVERHRQLWPARHQQLSQACRLLYDKFEEFAEEEQWPRSACQFYAAVGRGFPAFHYSRSPTLEEDLAHEVAELRLASPDSPLTPEAVKDCRLEVVRRWNLYVASDRANADYLYKLANAPVPHTGILKVGPADFADPGIPSHLTHREIMALCKRSPSVANDESLAVFLRYLPATIPDPDPSRDGLDNSLAIPIIVGGRLLTTVTLVDEFSSDEEGMPGWWLSPMISVLNSLDKDCSAAPQGTIYWGQFVGLLLTRWNQWKSEDPEHAWSCKALWTAYAPIALRGVWPRSHILFYRALGVPIPAFHHSSFATFGDEVESLSMAARVANAGAAPSDEEMAPQATSIVNRWNLFRWSDCVNAFDLRTAPRQVRVVPATPPFLNPFVQVREEPTVVSIPVASTELSAIPGAADLVKLLRPPRRLPLPTAGPAVLGGPSAVAESMPSPPGDTQVAQTFSPVLGSPMVLDPDLPDGDLPSPGPPRSPEAFPAISPPPSPSPAAVQPDASLSGRLPPGARVGPPVGRRKSGPKVATPSAKVLGKRKARSDVEESPVAAETPPAVRRSTRVKKRRGSNPGGGNDIQKVPAPAKTQGKKAKAPVLTAQGTKPYRAAGTPRGTFIDRTDIKYPHRICGGETAHAKFVDMRCSRCFGLGDSPNCVILEGWTRCKACAKHTRDCSFAETPAFGFNQDGQRVKSDGSLWPMEPSSAPSVASLAGIRAGLASFIHAIDVRSTSSDARGPALSLARTGRDFLLRMDTMALAASDALGASGLFPDLVGNGLGVPGPSKPRRRRRSSKTVEDPVDEDVDEEEEDELDEEEAEEAGEAKGGEDAAGEAEDAP